MDGDEAFLVGCRLVAILVLGAIGDRAKICGDWFRWRCRSRFYFEQGGHPNIDVKGEGGVGPVAIHGEARDMDIWEESWEHRLLRLEVYITEAMDLAGIQRSVLWDEVVLRNAPIEGRGCCCAKAPERTENYNI